MFNLKNSTALAVQQDGYIALLNEGGTLSEKQIKDMQDNLWVATANKLAPGNLVVRQYCLIDLAKKAPINKDKIFRLVNLLTYNEPGGYKTWAEGYSYFMYTMMMLGPWIAKFEATNDLTVLKKQIQSVKDGYVVTSYLRNGAWYPAPVGDTRDGPMDKELQVTHSYTSIEVSSINFNFDADSGNIEYNIAGKPVGLNVHIPKDDYTVVVREGVPIGFHFYEGYNKKYKSSWEELKDTFSPKRLKSIPF